MHSLSHLLQLQLQVVSNRLTVADMTGAVFNWGVDQYDGNHEPSQRFLVSSS